ncbi:MAG: amidohydrolase family protein, partial [Myxococcota bacterium]
PPGGRIVRDPSGAPTGVVVDAAVALLKIPEPTEAIDRARLQTALVLIAAKGLTGVDMMGATDRWVGILEGLDREGKLPVRLWVYVDPATDAAERLLRDGPWAGDGGRLRVVGIKAYADGALGSRGALLSAPYADAPDTTGTERTSAAELASLAERALGAGVQLAVHAIGDRAVTETLDAFAAARAAHPDRAAVPLRVEHAQVVRPEDVPRFAALGVVASMQPTHATSDAPWAEDRLGPDRIRWAYAWRTLADAGAPIAFGSDFPVEAVDPALGLVAATTRGGWTIDQVVSWDEAVAGFTSGAARAVGADDALGTLTPGKLADLTLWTVDDAGRWRAAGTVVGGEPIATSP